jgi:hypothetical protein
LCKLVQKHICEKTFSLLKLNKPTQWNQLTDENLRSSLWLTTASIMPDLYNSWHPQCMPNSCISNLLCFSHFNILFLLFTLISNYPNTTFIWKYLKNLFVFSTKLVSIFLPITTNNLVTVYSQTKSSLVMWPFVTKVCASLI